MLDIFADAATQGEMVVNATAGAVMLDVLSRRVAPQAPPQLYGL